MTETSIVDFHKSFYITAIQKHALNLTQILIIATHHCGNTRQEALNCCSSYQDVLCSWDDSDFVVASFAHQIKSEYHGGNRSVSIECIALENFSTTYQETSFPYLLSCKHHAVFHYYILDDIKQDAATTAAHSKNIIELLKNRKLLFLVSVLYGIIHMSV